MTQPTEVEIAARRDLTHRTAVTGWEWVGLQRQYNLADGHAHGSPNDAFQVLAGAMPKLFHEAVTTPHDDVERQFLDRFDALTGQQAPPGCSSFYYAASVGIEVAAKALRSRGVRRMGILHPSFDNIPALLSRHSIATSPVHEEVFEHPERMEDVLARVDGLFLVIPNNPTGFEPTHEQLVACIERCAAHRVAVVLDLSFRLYSDALSTWRQHATLAELMGDTPFLVLEDTGKAFPLAELKVGMLTFPERIRSLIQIVSDEVLLNVSPFTLLVLREAIRLELERRRSGQTLTCRQVVDQNRLHVRSAIADARLGIEVVSTGSSISVELLRLPGSADGVGFARELARTGVVVLPGRPFYWGAGALVGADHIRLALYRSPTYFRRAVDAFVEHASGVLQQVDRQRP